MVVRSWGWRQIKCWLNDPNAFLTLAGIILTLAGITVALWQYIDNNNQKRRDATVQYLVKFSEMLANTDPVLLDTINLFNNKTYGQYPYNEYGSLDEHILTKLLIENKSYRTQLDNIMTTLNQLAIGFQKGFYDESTAWYSNRHRIINASNALEPYYRIREKDEHFDGKSHRVCWFLRNMIHRWHAELGECSEWKEESRQEIERQWKRTRRFEEEKK